ncbi:MAG: DUF1801 domain-containing protein [Bacteroidia bacterium]|nr:DUF1801 domain-containing protein [Bacteroidia bacterium]
MKTVNAYIDQCSPVHQEKLIRIQQIILSCSPVIEEKIRYKIPFYDYYGRMLCYLNPLKNGNIDLGFCQGNLMSDYHKVLEVKNRSQIRSIEITEDFPDDAILRETLHEALLINEFLYQEKKKRKK